MESIQVSLQGESSQPLPKGISAKAALERLKGAVPPEVFAVKANGVEIDLLASLETDSTLQPLMFDSPEGKEIYRHSSTHIMAQAVKECFPSAQLT
ncbi:MAG: threonine--tRNA ligase, partial [Nitrospira sp.]|nr:threonine--tRNA ligase [Nitrospira sp.]